jgi:outer membrane protein TolC
MFGKARKPGEAGGMTRRTNLNKRLRYLGLTLALMSLLCRVPAKVRAQPDTEAIPNSEGQLPPPRTMDEETSAKIPAPPPLRLADAIRRSLANVQTVQANVAVQSATVGRFEALRQFVPLSSLPQLMYADRRFTNGPRTIDYPDVTGITGLAGQPGLDHGEYDRVYMFLPLDPSGQITAIPIAEEGIHAKVLMEQMVRRSQAALAIQGYFEAKQIQYGMQVARAAVNLADETLAQIQRRLAQKQAYEVEVMQARVAASRSRLLLADLEKSSRIRQRGLAVTLHQSRLLVPQTKPIPIALDNNYCFDLEDPDFVNLRIVPDFPACRADAIELAKRQRMEVQIQVVGLRIAQLAKKRSLLGLLGLGSLPINYNFKNTTPGTNGGVAMGLLFGSIYSVPLTDVGLWANLRRGRLDIVQSQLDLEKALLDVAADAGNSWDRWQQAQKEWEQTEFELEMRQQLLQRQERLYEQKQVIWLDVLGARFNLMQADANRWTAWYSLQLARLDILRATELLLDYVEKAKIADVTAWQKPPPPSLLHRWLPWLARPSVTK